MGVAMNVYIIHKLQITYDQIILAGLFYTEYIL